MSPQSVPSWKPGAGGLPSCLSGSRTWSHFTQCTKTLPPPTPHPSKPSLSLPVFSLLSRLNLAPPSLSLLSLSPFPIYFPFLPSPCLQEIHPLTDQSQFLLTFWYTQHFLSGLWGPALCPINATVSVFAVVKNGGAILLGFLRNNPYLNSRKHVSLEKEKAHKWYIVMHIRSNFFFFKLLNVRWILVWSFHKRYCDPGIVYV